MDARTKPEPAAANATTMERASDLEVVIRRTVDAPARLVFQAFAKADLFRQWWVPKSLGLTLLSCEMDVRVGGKYRLVFRQGDATMAFHGTYLDVVPNALVRWSNEESGEGGAVTTVTFEEKSGKTLVVVRDRYASKEAADAGMASGAYDAMPETFNQLDALLQRQAGRRLIAGS